MSEFDGLCKTLKHPACIVGWVARLCCSWLSPGKATRIFHERSANGTIQFCIKKNKKKGPSFRVWGNWNPCAEVEDPTWPVPQRLSLWDAPAPLPDRHPRAVPSTRQGKFVIVLLVLFPLYHFNCIICMFVRFRKGSSSNISTLLVLSNEKDVLCHFCALLFLFCCYYYFFLFRKRRQSTLSPFSNHKTIYTSLVHLNNYHPARQRRHKAKYKLDNS